MNELPELPFEKVLSYLSLDDRLKARAVSRRWYWTINSFQVKTLFYSRHRAGFIKGKHRLISGAFAQNFIYSAQGATFFTFFNASLISAFSNLKHLRLYDFKVELNKKQRKTFASVLRSFDRLEQLDIIGCRQYVGLPTPVKLHFPMLTGLWIDRSIGFGNLRLNAPRLQKIRACFYYRHRLELVHPESVEWLMVSRWTAEAVEEMKNLKYLYLTGDPKDFSPSLISSLEQLKEIHLSNSHDLFQFFEQKRRYARADLKIFYSGLLLTSPDDPAIRSLKSVLLPDDLHSLLPDDPGYFSDEAIGCLAENSSRLADEIPFCRILRYSAVERVTPELQTSLFKRFTHLRQIYVLEPVEDTERFLNLLKNLDIESLEFCCDQPQDLFDRLPEHCAVQELTISANMDLDARFLSRMKHLMELSLEFWIDAEAIRTILEKLGCLSSFNIGYRNIWASIEIRYAPKRFDVSASGVGHAYMSDPDAVISFISSSYIPEEEPERSWSRRTQLTYADALGF